MKKIILGLIVLVLATSLLGQDSVLKDHIKLKDSVYYYKDKSDHIDFPTPKPTYYIDSAKCPNDPITYLKHDTKFIVSDLLELHANETERSRGCDLADYLIKYDWRTLKHEHCIPSNLQKIIKKNPAVQTLIDALDLTPSLAS